MYLHHINTGGDKMVGMCKVTLTDEMDYDTIYALLQRNYRVWVYVGMLKRELCIGTSSKSIGYETYRSGETYQPLIELMQGKKVTATVEYQIWVDKTVEDLIDDRPLSIDDIKDYLLD